MSYVLKNKARFWGWPMLAAGLFAYGCLSDSSSETQGNLPDNGIATHELKQMATCDDLLVYAKSAAIQRLTTYAQLQKSEIENCWYSGDDYTDGTDYSTDSDSGGSSSDGDADGDADNGSEDEPAVDGDGDSDGDQGGDDSYSNTNVQEQGVDEPDLVKTDGDYIYTLHAGELVIVQVGDTGSLTEAGRVTVGGYAQEILIKDNLAVVYSAMQRDEVPESIRMPEPEWYSGYYGGYVDYDGYYGGYEGGFYGDGYTQITIVDMTNRAAPVVARNVIYAGSYVTARMVGDSVRSVVSTSTPALDIPYGLNWWEYCDMPEDMGMAVFEAAYNAYIQEATDMINELTIDDLLPKKIDQLGAQAASAQYIVECTDVYGPETAEGNGLMTVASLDLTQYQTPQTDIAVFGQRGLVYASTSSLYLTTSKDYVWQAWESGLWADETSGIHKFDIATDPGKAIYKATGTVTGRMLDQFCLGEYNGFLRVATTLGDVWMPGTVDNQISVFQEQADKLERVGFLSGIAKAEGEEIYAARFVGDRGFMVTFLQTDPLFTFDLSDPTNPRQVGEWKGPGYSTYMHPFGDNHMITFGEEDWQMTLSLYDLTDFANPTLVQRYYPGGDTGSYSSISSSALSDHKAITFYNYNNEDLMAFPFQGWSYDYYSSTYENGIMLVAVNTSGFEARGSMLMQSEQNYYWYGNESEARRAVFVNDTIFGISRCRVAAANLADVGTILGNLPLYTGDNCNDSGDSYDDGYDGGDVDVDSDADGDTAPDYPTETETETGYETETGTDYETDSDSE